MIVGGRVMVCVRGLCCRRDERVRGVKGRSNSILSVVYK